MNGGVTQQSPKRLHNRLPSRSDGCGQGWREPARPARTLDGEPERRLSLRSTSDALLKPDIGDHHRLSEEVLSYTAERYA
jgi:hypothetical protein